MGVGYWAISAYMWMLTVISTAFYNGVVIDTGTDTDINKVLDLNMIRFVDLSILGGQLTMPLPNPSFFEALFNLCTFQSPLFDGELNMVRWMLVAVFGFPIIIKLIQEVSPVIIQAASFLRSFIPIPRP